MAADVTIRGAEQLEALARRIKETGDTTLRRDLLRGIQRAAKPLKSVAQTSARNSLPRTGGLNEVVAASKFSVRTRMSGRSPGVRVFGVSGHDIDAMDHGIVRHPVYPGPDRSKWTWAVQHIEPGWWSEALEAETPAIRREVVKAMEEVARKL